MPASNLPLTYLFQLRPREVIEWFRAKGYDISWNWRDVWKEAHAEAFTVAKATQLDVLTDLREGVQRIFTEGISRQRFKAELERRMRARGWWGREDRVNPRTGKTESVQLGSPHRLETIYRTNAQVGFQRGRYQQQRRLQNVRPFWQYVAVMDSRTRHAHAALNGKCYLASSDVWNRIYPPNGFNCRCRIRALTPAEVARKGIKVEETGGLPDGFPDEGWDYNPHDPTPPPGLMPAPGSIPPELDGWPISAQEAELLRILDESGDNARLAGIDPDAVAAVSRAMRGTFAPLPDPPRPGAPPRLGPEDDE